MTVSSEVTQTFRNVKETIYSGRPNASTFICWNKFADVCVRLNRESILILYKITSKDVYYGSSRSFRTRNWSFSSRPLIPQKWSNIVSVKKLTRLFNFKIQLNYTINERVSSQRYRYIQYKQKYISASKTLSKTFAIEDEIKYLIPTESES